MGTSQSSDGPSSGVPMVPSWVPDPPLEGDAAQQDDSAAPDSPSPVEPAPVPIPIAPPARFLAARRSLGSFARTGDGRDMRRGVGHYVRKGYGGAGTASRRFGGTVATARTLHGVLSSLAAGRPAPGSPLDPALLVGRSVEEVITAVVEAVKPIDGTQDAEAARASIRDALSELLTRFPDADLMNLEADERNFVIERYAAIDVSRRFELDVGKTIQEKAPTTANALSRLKEARNYVKETVAASFRKLRDSGRTLAAGWVSRVVHDALHETFQVFEGYAE
jgi:hypothetical protein